MHSVSSLKRDRPDLPLSEVVDRRRLWLYEQDRSAGTVKKDLQAVAHFLEWYEREERVQGQLAALTPIALIGCRSALQHEQHQSVSITLRETQHHLSRFLSATYHVARCLLGFPL